MKKTQFALRAGAALAVLTLAAPAFPCEAMKTTMASKESQVSKEAVASKTAAKEKATAIAKKTAKPVAVSSAQ